MFGFFPDDVQVVLRKTNADIERYPNVTELNIMLKCATPEQLASYNDVTYVHVYDSSRELPSAWPARMQILDVRFSKCRKEDVPPFPATLRTANFIKCPMLFEFDVHAVCAACPDLEEIVLYGSGVRSLHGNDENTGNRPRPLSRTESQLRVVDVSYTPVHSVRVDELPLNLTLLYISGNYRSEGRGVVMSYNTSARLGLEIVGDNVQPIIPGRREELLPDQGRTAGGTSGNNPFRQLWKQEHNVHARSVQECTNSSMSSLWQEYQKARAQIDAYTSTWDRDWLESCRKSLVAHKTRGDPPFASLPDSSSSTPHSPSPPSSCASVITSVFGTMISTTHSASRLTYDPLDNYLDDSTAHSVHALTLQELLKRVWTVICVHPSRRDLLAVLYDELGAGRLWCFTGRFTRLMNVLCGFVGGIDIGISLDEQMQNRLSVLWKEAQALQQERDAFSEKRRIERIENRKRTLGEDYDSCAKGKEREEGKGAEIAAAIAAIEEAERLEDDATRRERTACADRFFEKLCGVVIFAEKEQWEQADTWLNPFIDVIYPDPPPSEDELCLKFVNVLEKHKNKKVAA